MVDIHLHTEISHDSSEPAENYVKAALAAGDSVLGFAEHYDYDEFLDGGNSPLSDIPEYDKRISALRKAFHELKILQGVELGYSEAALPHYKELLKAHPFDCVILSVHALHGRGDCYYPAFFKGLDKPRAYSAYLEAVLASVNSGLDYNVIAHIGYVARYAPYPDRALRYSDFPALFDEIFKSIIRLDKCLEINTSAKGTGEQTVPPADVLERYISLGGRNFSFGSDSHTAARYKENEAAVKKFLLEHGITETCHFESGKCVRSQIFL